MSSLQEQQDSLHKQKIEGFSEYSNDLNELTSKQFTKFLVTVPQTIRPHSKDLKNFVRDGIKPFYALKEIIEFFSKENDVILDVFSGAGENLKLISELERSAVGIEKDAKKISSYKADVCSDTFLSEFPVTQGDALKILEKFFDKFDFILVDPPIKSQKSSIGAENIEERTVDSYCNYIANVLENCSKNIKRGKFVVCLVQDFYCKGEYFMLPSMIASRVMTLKLKGVKIYSRQVDINTIPNKKVYAPVQNHFYALIFTA